MQRPPSKKSRPKTAQEKAFQSFIKEQPCSFCGKPAPSIVDHWKGSSFKLKIDLVTRQIGDICVNAKCKDCDDIVTHERNRQKLYDKHGKNDSQATVELIRAFGIAYCTTWEKSIVDAISGLCDENEELTDWEKIL